MPDYDLGTAHGRIRIDYDGRKGAQQAEDDFASLGDSAEKLVNRFRVLGAQWRRFKNDFADDAATIARRVAVVAGSAALLAGFSGVIRGFGGALLGLRGGLGIIGALGVTMGRLPRSVADFPSIIKKVILLSSAITLFVGSTQLIAKLADHFPVLRNFSKHITNIGKSVNRLGRPIHTIARLALAVGALRSGIRIATALAKALSILGAASSILVGLVAVVYGLVDAIEQLSGVLGLIPGGIFVAAAALGTLVLGLQGYSKALKSVFAEQKEFDEAIKNLAPNAQQTLRSIRGLKEEFQGLQKSIQNRLFHDTADDIERLAAKYVPMLNVELGKVADSLNNAWQNLAGFLNDSRTLDDVRYSLGLSAEILERLGNALKPFLHGLRNIGVVSLQALRDLTGGLEAAANRFEAWTERIRSDGSLRNWIDGGIQGIRELWGIITGLAETFNIIFSKFGVEGEGALAKLNNAIDNFNNTLRSNAGQQVLGELIGTILHLAAISREVLGTAVREIGPAFLSILPFIREVATVFGVVLVNAIKILGPLLTDLAGLFNTLSPVLAPVLGTLLAIGVGAKAVGLAFGLLRGTIGLIVSGFTILRGAISAITAAWRLLTIVFALSPWGLIITGLILLAFLIYKYWDQIKAFLITAWNFIKVAAAVAWNAIWGVIGPIVTSIVNFIKSVWSGIAAFFTTIWNAIKFVVSAGINAVMFVIQGVLSVIGAIWNAFWSVFGGIITGVWELIKAVIALALRIIQFGLFTFLHVVGAIWETTWNAIKAVTEAVWGFIKDLAQTVWGFIGPYIMGVVRAIESGVSAAWNGIKAVTSFVWNIIKTFVMAGINAVKAVVQAGLNFLKSVWEAAWNQIKGPVTAAWNFIKNAVSAGIDAVVGLAKSIGGRVLSAVGNLGKLLWNAGKSIIQGLIDGIESMLGKVTGTLKRITNMIPDVKGPPTKDAKLLIDNGRLIMQGLMKGIIERIPALRQILQSIGDKQVPLAFSMSEISNRGSGQAPFTPRPPGRRDFPPTAPVVSDAVLRSMINNLNVTLPPGTSVEQFVNRIMFEVRRVGKGVYSVP